MQLKADVHWAPAGSTTKHLVPLLRTSGHHTSQAPLPINWLLNRSDNRWL